MNTPQNYFDNRQGLEELQLENIQLKKKLEREELLHKSLYRQWSELNDSVLAKERQLEQFNSGSLFYKYAFYVILLALIPGYYFLGRSKGEEKITPDPQVASSPAAVTNQLPINTRDTVQLTEVTPVEKKAIQTDTVQQKLPTLNKPVINKPVTMVPEDKPIARSARDSIYSQGWDAYHKQLRNPYQRSSQKFEVWLEGWKDGEKGVKKVPAKDPLAH